MVPRKYDSPAAFKQALEQRLKSSSKDGYDFARRRQLLVFDRFIARVQSLLGKSVVLKGGLVLELRLARARTTRDVDLRITGPAENILDRLQEAGQLDLGDFMTFEVRPDPVHPDIKNDGKPYDGQRFRTEARLAGKLYGQAFGVDIGFADPILGEPELQSASDLLAFAAIPTPVFLVYPVESHIAEKLHAYTMPRQRENSRVKDLPDIALLGKIRELDGDRLRLALERTFEFRGTHSIPDFLPDPPSAWSEVYRRMALEDDLEWIDMPGLLKAARTFLYPILAGKKNLHWSPSQWQWK